MPAAAHRAPSILERARTSVVYGNFVGDTQKTSFPNSNTLVEINNENRVWSEKDVEALLFHLNRLGPNAKPSLPMASPEVAGVSFPRLQLLG